MRQTLSLEFLIHIRVTTLLNSTFLIDASLFVLLKKPKCHLLYFAHTTAKASSEATNYSIKALIYDHQKYNFIFS